MTVNLLPLDIAAPSIWKMMISEPSDGTINKWKFFEPAAQLSPDERLAQATLLKACEDFLAVKIARRHYESARLWIQTAGLNGWTFDFVCSTLGLDPAYLRRRLREAEPAEREFIREKNGYGQITLTKVPPHKVQHVKRCLLLELTLSEIMRRCRVSQEVVKEVGKREYGADWMRARGLRIMALTHTRHYRRAFRQGRAA